VFKDRDSERGGKGGEGGSSSQIQTPLHITGLRSAGKSHTFTFTLTFLSWSTRSIKFSGH